MSVWQRPSPLFGSATVAEVFGEIIDASPKLGLAPPALPDRPLAPLTGFAGCAGVVSDLSIRRR